MKTVEATSFSPRYGPSGTVISVSVAPGAIDALAGVLDVGMAYFLQKDGGENYPCAIQVMDADHYTSFLVVVPHQIQSVGEYVFFFTMINPHDLNVWEVRSPAGETFYVTSSVHPISINKITPARVRRSELSTAMFTITGTSLDRLDRAMPPKILSGPPIRMSYLNVTPSMARLRVASGLDVQSIHPGTYRVQFTDYFEEDVVFAKTPLTISD